MIHIRNLSYTYPDQAHPALSGVCWQVAAGELCLVMGPSGAGKSTLLRCINGLVPHFSGGSLSGIIRVNGLDPVQLAPREMSKTVGFVFQDPEAQFVVDCVEDEIAFSLENSGMPGAEMEARIHDVLALLDISALRMRRLETLSGGERQRVAIASALALRPQVLVLDEPTSQLDPHSADEVLHSLMQLNKQLGLTVVLAEHRLERILPYAGQIMYLSAEYPGGLSGDPRSVLSRVPLNPPVVDLGKALGWQPLPLTVPEAQACARQSGFVVPRASSFEEPVKPEVAFIQAKGVKVNFGKINALDGVDLQLAPGEVTALMGPNGAGKSTLLRAMIGLLPVQAGTILLEGRDIAGRSVAEICQRVGYLPQDPNALLFADTVLEELFITLKNHHLEPADGGLQPMTLLEQLGLGNKADAYPRDLSAGERQRVALGAVMVTKPGALLLDEPTRGLDYAAKQILLGLLHTWRDQGMAILLVTHDVELAAQAADWVILLENGRVSAQGTPRQVMSGSEIFSTQVSKIFPGSGWLTARDAIGGFHAGKH